VVLDTQSIRTANHVPAATTGKDAGKRVPGRKRGLAVDVLGLIIAVVVMAASPARSSSRPSRACSRWPPRHHRHRTLSRNSDSPSVLNGQISTNHPLSQPRSGYGIRMRRVRTGERVAA
jgi:hypothetical protein